MKIASVNIMAGFTAASLIDDFVVKMIGIGLATGAEGAFSALFTILINESSRISNSLLYNFLVPETKMRSTLISGCFVAYGIGCVVLNFLAIYIKSADGLAITASVLLYLSCIPSFFSYHETPRYLHKTGQFSRLIRNLVRISKANRKVISSDEFSEDFDGLDILKIVKIDKLEIILEEIEEEETTHTEKVKQSSSSIKEFFGSFR